MLQNSITYISSLHNEELSIIIRCSRVKRQSTENPALESSLASELPKESQFTIRLKKWTLRRKHRNSQNKTKIQIFPLKKICIRLY